MQRSSKGKEDPYFFHSVSQPLFSEGQTITKGTQTLFEQIFDRLFYLAAVRRDGAYVLGQRGGGCLDALCLCSGAVGDEGHVTNPQLPLRPQLSARNLPPFLSQCAPTLFHARVPLQWLISLRGMLL